MAQQTPQFHLSSILADHLDQVRSVATNFSPLAQLQQQPSSTESNMIITCSLDRTLKVWRGPITEEQFQQKQIQKIRDQLQSEFIKMDSRYDLDVTLVGHENFVIDAMYAAPEQGGHEGTGSVISVSHDKSIIYWNPTDGNIQRKIANAHEANISCVHLCAEQDMLITGSWDKTAKVWRVSTGEQLHHLKGHEMNVLCVLALQSGEIVTGSGDGSIKVWRDGMEIKTQSNAHTTCVRSLALWPGVGFLSCANDGVVKIWSFDGVNLLSQGQFQAHSTLVYSVLFLPSTNEIITCSEDYTVKIWRGVGDCAQTLQHPNTVWRAALLSNGDIVTACADRMARVWTRDPQRVATEEVLRAHKDQLDQSKKQTAGGVKVSELPTAESLTERGKKDGEIKVINEDGSARAYSWNASQGQWDLVGDVVDGPSVGSDFAGKECLNGKFYDHVFDVEIDDTGRKYKIGFNNGDNPYSVASDFCLQNGLSAHHVETVAQYIAHNFASSMDVQPSSTSLSHLNPWASSPSSSASAPVASTQTLQQKQQQLEERERQKKAQHFPRDAKVHGFDIMESANYAGIVKKIKEFNVELRNNASLSTLSLSTQEESLLDDIANRLQQQQQQKSTPLEGGQVQLNEQHMGVMDKLLRWPPAKQFPGLDLLRLVILQDTAAHYYAHSERKLISTILAVGFHTNAANNAVLHMMSLRVMSNMFRAREARSMVTQEARQILEVVAPVCTKATEDRVKGAYAKLLHNMALYFSAAPEDQEFVTRTLVLDHAQALLINLQPTTSVDVSYPLLCAIGTLASTSEDMKQRAKLIGTAATVAKLVFAADAKVAGAAYQLSQLLKQ